MGRPASWVSAFAGTTGLICGLILLAATLLGYPAQAEPRHMIVQDLEYPWSAVGRLNVANHGYCSAVMISERHLLTAAHCLWNRGEERWWPARAIRFVPGFQGEAVLIATLKSYVVADGYHFALHPGVPELSNDWAVAELAEPLGRQTGWLAAGLPAAGGPAILAHAGYRQDHRYGLSLDYGCRILRVPPQIALLMEDCIDMAGDSGGPVLVFQGDAPTVAGIVVATTNRDGGQTVAVPIASLTDTVRFPVAAKAALAAGVGRGHAQPPEPGGPVGPVPKSALKTLGAASGHSAPFAELTRALDKTSEASSKP